VTDPIPRLNFNIVVIDVIYHHVHRRPIIVAGFDLGGPSQEAWRKQDTKGGGVQQEAGWADRSSRGWQVRLSGLPSKARVEADGKLIGESSSAQQDGDHAL
jgi:hypothetical protein